VPGAEVLQRFETALAVTREFIAGVEELAGGRLPNSVCRPPYEHCTAEDLELIEAATGRLA
jgi:hypothetical protein